MRNPVVTVISTRKPGHTEWYANEEVSVSFIFISKLKLEVWKCTGIKVAN